MDVSDVVNFVVLTLVVEVSDEEVSDDREEKSATPRVSDAYDRSKLERVSPLVRDLVLVTVTDGVGFRDEVVAVEETRFFVGVVLVCLEVFELLDVPAGV